jgi:Glycosyltransferase family 28 N-terminal domain
MFSAGVIFTFLVALQLIQKVSIVCAEIRTAIWQQSTTMQLHRMNACREASALPEGVLTLKRRLQVSSLTGCLERGPKKLIHRTGDGRIDIKLDPNNNSLSKLLAPTPADSIGSEQKLASPPPPSTGVQSSDHCPSLNIVMQLVGSRGDIQPFLAVGLQLQALGHRVRIASHLTFQSFVEDTGLEFFSIGGDPIELMAYMVRNAGLLPDFHAVLSGDVRRKRRAIQEVMEGCWRSCMETGNGIHTDSKQWRDSKPFVADAIISNPPTFSHIHCAERLGIPLHIMFT